MTKPNWSFCPSCKILPQDDSRNLKLEHLWRLLAQKSDLLLALE
jgi:hypothetical protein